jgi:hypothetical protein
VGKAWGSVTARVGSYVEIYNPVIFSRLPNILSHREKIIVVYEQSMIVIRT